MTQSLSASAISSDAHADSPAPLQQRGLLFVIASPSGAGKSTLTKLLLQTEKNISMSISVTTRKRRGSEVEGVHYYFTSVEAYKSLQARGGLLEGAEVHGNFYGTPREPVEKALAEGRDVLFDIDVQGTAQLREKMHKDLVSVFILPPSIPELISRLHRRAEDDEATIRKRLASALTEMKAWRSFDYVLMNDDLNRCFSELQAILAAERLRRSKRDIYAPIIAKLTDDLESYLASQG